jgi:hypothetical protein
VVASAEAGQRKGAGDGPAECKVLVSGQYRQRNGRVADSLPDSYIRARQSGGLKVARKPVLHEQDYVVSDGAVRLTVVVGERQFGSSIVFLDDDVIGNGHIDELLIGDGDKLEGKTLSVYTLVTDIRRDVDDMAVTWILVGGGHRLMATAIGTPAKKFGSQMFKGVFKLAAP